jgi:hypothetical protein
MDRFNDEIDGVLFRRPGVGGESTGRLSQLARARLRAGVGTHIIDRRTEQQLLVKVGVVVVQQRILRTDINLNSVLDAKTLNRFKTFSDLLITPFVARGNGESQ